MRGESQFGRFINRDTGAILAENTSGLIPTPGGQETALTEFVLTQFLSEEIAIFAGNYKPLTATKTLLLTVVARRSL
ncbi:MAG: hypothetical protein ACI9HK_006284 [Pirellulaceae bacterium]|jgi:hypothetical protein